MIKSFVFAILRTWHNHKANLYLRTADKSKCKKEAQKLMEKCSFHHQKYINYLTK
ncbi:hypothetical protein J2S74_000423 [Evansella vedderi]|uniref:Uncharacterized protein n=1 Tax=Evansella vedderi TaxID=38282 RepID=A0ABT9ZP83_9BACI|nr:hypothetical protein [Evansella vedderi]